MSIILSYINEDYVAIVADKRESTKYRFLPMQHRDDIVKVHNKNNVIFALCGHSEYINEFMAELPDFKSIKEFKSYVAKKINKIQQLRMDNDEILARLKFNIHYAYIHNSKPSLQVYFLSPNDLDIIYADVPINFHQVAASWPDIVDQDSYENEVAKDYPINIFDVKCQAANIIERVSKETEFVSEIYDWEYLLV